jgi:hypothetical protein
MTTKRVRLPEPEPFTASCGCVIVFEETASVDGGPLGRWVDSVSRRIRTCDEHAEAAS